MTVTRNYKLKKYDSNSVKHNGNNDFTAELKQLYLITSLMYRASQKSLDTLCFDIT